MNIFGVGMCMLRETRKLCFSRIALVGRRRSVRACQIYPSSCCFKDHWRVGGRRRRWRAGALVGGLLDVAKIKDLQSRASTCSKTLVAEGQMRCECCARFRHVMHLGHRFQHPGATARPASSASFIFRPTAWPRDHTRGERTTPPRWKM